MTSESQGVFAIVWRGASMPADLAAALTRQGIRWTEAAGPFEALSRLLAARTEAPQARVLLIVEPDRHAETDQIRAAVERFDPQSACWAFREASNPKLAPLPRPTPTSEPEVVVRAAAPNGHAKPQTGLRLTRETETPAPSQSGPTLSRPSENPHSESERLERRPDPQPPRSLLTPEELAMLLADDR